MSIFQHVYHVYVQIKATLLQKRCRGTLHSWTYEPKKSLYYMTCCCKL